MEPAGIKRFFRSAAGTENAKKDDGEKKMFHVDFAFRMVMSFDYFEKKENIVKI